MAIRLIAAQLPSDYPVELESIRFMISENESMTNLIFDKTNLVSNGNANAIETGITIPEGKVYYTKYVRTYKGGTTFDSNVKAMHAKTNATSLYDVPTVRLEPPMLSFKVVGDKVEFKVSPFKRKGKVNHKSTHWVIVNKQGINFKVNLYDDINKSSWVMDKSLFSNEEYKIYASHVASNGSESSFNQLKFVIS